MILRDLLEHGVRAIGIQGVSTVVLVGLLSVALYVHKLSAVSGLVVNTGGTVAHDMKVIALVLALLLVAGVISADVGRAQEIVHLAWDQIQSNSLLEEVQRVV
ncbi:hypothetical protein IL252_11390 [Halomicrobium sp. IBSBa]|uniref:hypothetical protein n=1 Tax=Halomicrobium sp. IBSBa TaxID=2778916 RepID=UPI001ABF4DFB|nr:hypothetical protein [Halomicrobium sp. IBSBa]MBO4248418.1 hypothetical protein [Halomicrobium sp. IBSBa]